MKFILILIMMNSNGSFELSEIKDFNEMDACFKAREDVVHMLGRPIVNYQVICVNKKFRINNIEHNITTKTNM